MEKELRRFRAANENGRRYVLVEYQQYSLAHAKGGVDQVLNAGKIMRTEDGNPVNVIDDNTFEIITGPPDHKIIVRRVQQ